MTEALIVSNLVLWVAVVLLAGVTFALVRQIGVLHERVAPAGALTFGRGPKVGEAAPVLSIADLSSQMHELGAERTDGLSTLLFFLSPTCPVCKTLLPVLRSFARTERSWLRILLASDGPKSEHQVDCKYRRPHERRCPTQTNRRVSRPKGGNHDQCNQQDKGLVS